MSLTEDVKDEASWDWMMRGDLMKETEGLTTAAQDQALRTNVIKAKIKKQQLSPLCRMYDMKDKTVGHLLCGCSKDGTNAVQAPVHDNIAGIVLWSTAKQQQ